MKSNNLTIKTKKIITLIAVISFTAMFLGLLFFNLRNSTRTHLRPILTDSPIYIEIPSDEELSINFNMNESISISGIDLLMVNVDSSGNGSIELNIVNSSGDTISNVSVQEKEIKAGEWNTLACEASFSNNESYTITISPKDCSPYLMYVPKLGMSTLPLSEELFLNDEKIDSNVSVGLSVPNNTISINPVFIVLTLILISACILLLLWIWNESSFTKLSALISKSKDIVFLIIVFAFICIDIYSNAYKNGIQISADSSGYLREAANLRVGNGYSYDGLAGYNSWFANWPILYPFLIFISMLISGQDPYLASKFLSAVLCLVIISILLKRYKTKAYIYSIVLLNIGFLYLCQYTWSEVPFILFMLLFAFKLEDILSETKATAIDYIKLSLYGLLTFLTRYFGIFVFAVVGIYIIAIFIDYLKNKDKTQLIKAIKLTISAFIGGILSIGYLMLNKIMNGMPSGVSRSDWWDDYSQLTKDLIDSLVTEIFNIFHIDITSFITNINYPLKAVIILIIFAMIVRYLVKKVGILTSRSVLIIMPLTYYLMFIVIRYFSSMDTFYFRFFEPATFLLTIGLINEIRLHIKNSTMLHIVNGVYALIFAIMIISITNTIFVSMNIDTDYYSIAKSEWDAQYEEIPERSVVIFSDLDYRSEYYRPDVVNGVIDPSDSVVTLREKYYGSNYLVIQKEYAEVMIESNAYSDDITKMLVECLSTNKDAKKYISCPL